MSRENVELVRRGIDAWNRDDLDERLAGLTQEAEWHTTGPVYRGREGLTLSQLGRGRIGCADP
jgi:hypothetical protein